MRIVVALLLALCYTKAYGVAMALCPDGAHWYPVSEGSSFCPADISVGTVAPTGTTVVLGGTVAVSSGTVHSAIRLNCTELQWRNTTKGTIAGAEADGDDTDVTSGAFSITVTGLAEDTGYCLHILQYAQDRPSKTVLLPFRTLDTTPPASGDSIAGGDDRFYCPDGSDGNSGLTHALRKANYPTTDATFSAGDDMWLCTGGVWTNAHHDVDRQGADTANGWNEIGCYYMDGATAKKCLDNTEGPGAVHTKPMIRGALTDTCLNAGTCTYPNSGWPVNGYTSRYDGLVMVSDTADYTEFRNIEISYGQYNSLTATGGGVEGGLHHLVLDGVDIKYNGISGRLTFIDGVTDFVVRNGDSFMQNTCATTRMNGASSDTAACTTSPWSGTYVTMTRNTGRALIENNTTRKGMGEGYNCFNTDLGYAIFRGNKSVNSHSDAIYLDGCPNSVVENNIVMGGSGVRHLVTTDASFSGVHVGCENTAYPEALNNLVRNNLIVGADSGIQHNLFSGCVTAGMQAGVKAYGNTIIASPSEDMAEDSIEQSDAASAVAEFLVTGNAIWQTLGAGYACLSSSASTFLDNHWSTAPSDTDCTGAGDTTGDLALTDNTYSSWQNLANVTGDAPVTWVTFANANPAGGSALIGSGTALTGAIRDIANFGYAWTAMTSPPSEANWECALCVDALGAVRANPPSKGAVE